LLQSLKQGQWQGSWSARNSAGSQVTLKVEAVNPAIPVSGTREISGGLRSAQDAPSADKTTIFSAAGLQPFVPVAPGSIITISGDRLAESSASAQTDPASNNLPGTELLIAAVPLPTNLAGTEVVMAGVPLPLLSVSQKQINAVVPNEIKINTSQQLLIRRGNTLSKPIALDVAAAQPAIFTTSDGNPIIFNGSAGGGNAALVNTRPAGTGDVLSMFTTGLGVTNPIVPNGTVSPSDPAATTQDAVSVTIGGVPAQVVSAVLMPGFVALYQINVTVPADLPSGDQLPVAVSVSGQKSPPVMIPVRH
jgi:uncharacterized protein (TIGR03437 family)